MLLANFPHFRLFLCFWTEAALSLGRTQAVTEHSGSLRPCHVCGTPLRDTFCSRDALGLPETLSDLHCSLSPFLPYLPPLHLAGAASSPVPFPMHSNTFQNGPSIFSRSHQHLKLIHVPLILLFLTWSYFPCWQNGFSIIFPCYVIHSLLLLLQGLPLGEHHCMLDLFGTSPVSTHGILRITVSTLQMQKVRFKWDAM